MAAIDLRARRRSHHKLEFLSTVAGAGALVLSAPGYTVALAAGHGGHGGSHSAHGAVRSTARTHFASGACPTPLLSSRGRVHFRALGAFVSLPGPYSPYVPSHETDYDTDFTDPSSSGYVPYCDSGSLYYDPSSCDEMIR
jgi:hypothetical protein